MLLNKQRYLIDRPARWSNVKAGLQRHSAGQASHGGPGGEPPERRPHGRDAGERQFHVARAAEVQVVQSSRNKYLYLFVKLKQNVVFINPVKASVSEEDDKDSDQMNFTSCDNTSHKYTVTFKWITAFWVLSFYLLHFKVFISVISFAQINSFIWPLF